MARSNIDEARARLLSDVHKIGRTAEMSAGIMRDAGRTGGWSGSERTANAFARIAERIYAVESDLATVLAKVTGA